MAKEDSMSQAEIVPTLKDIQRRVQSVDQMLPALAPKEELRTAIDARTREEGERRE
jgi:hypothetical protein